MLIRKTRNGRHERSDTQVLHMGIGREKARPKVTEADGRDLGTAGLDLLGRELHGLPFSGGSDAPGDAERARVAALATRIRAGHQVRPPRKQGLSGEMRG
jgi:hypothetical protein